jgi:predicted transcriptional regulator
MQIDPGFEGPLSVTLFNMTPNPISLNYKGHFVTMELEKLAVPASIGYGGQYQNRKTFLAEELDPMIGFKGHALTDVVKGFEDIRDAVCSVAEMSGKLDTFMQQHREEIRESQRFNHAIMAEMKKLVEHIAGERTKTVVLRALSKDDAKREVLDLFRSSTGPLFYSDIAERLQMDLEQVLEVTSEMEREGLIGVQDVHEPK